MNKLELNPLTGEFDVVSKDVLSYTNLASFPAVGQKDTLYVALDTYLTYLWDNVNTIYVSANLGGLQDFQQVTDTGNTTTNQVNIGTVGGQYLNLDAGTVANYDNFNAKGTIFDFESLTFINSSNQVKINAVTPLTALRTQTFQDASGTIALLSDIPTTENIQDVIGNMMVDTATIDFTYNDPANQLSAIVINNSIDNTKLAQAPANSFKANPTGSTANEQDVTMSANSVFGRDPLVNSGNLASLPLQVSIMGVATLVAGSAIVFDANITNTSFCVGICISSAGNITSVPVRWTASTGQMLFTTGQAVDTATFGYTILI